LSGKLHACQSPSQLSGVSTLCHPPPTARILRRWQPLIQLRQEPPCSSRACATSATRSRQRSRISSTTRSLPGQRKCAFWSTLLGYQREDIELELLAEGRQLTAITYTVVHRVDHLRTAPHYVKHIVDGLRSHGKPVEYIGYVKFRAETNNPREAESFRKL